MLTDTNINITKKRSIDEHKITVPKKTKTTNCKYHTVKNVLFYVVKPSNLNIIYSLFILLLFCFIIAKGYVHCGDRQPLWCCHNAFVPNNECVHVLCSECYGNAQNENKVKRNRGRASNLSSDCNDPHSFNHFLTNLIPFTDESYLDKDFLAKKINYGAIVPQICSNCHLQITSAKCIF